MTRAGRIHRNELVDLLSAALGDDKASQLVVKTAVGLGYSTFDFSLDEAASICDVIGREPGLVGITASLAKTRLPRLVRA